MRREWYCVPTAKQSGFPSENSVSPLCGAAFVACGRQCAFVDSIFGVNAGLFGTITARPQFGKLDPRAELRNINYQGKQYVADRNGVRPRKFASRDEGESRGTQDT